MERSYRPHTDDAIASQDALDAHRAGRLPLTSEELDALESVISAVERRGSVMQYTICRAHDAIAQYRLLG